MNLELTMIVWIDSAIPSNGGWQDIGEFVEDTENENYLMQRTVGQVVKENASIICIASTISIHLGKDDQDPLRCNGGGMVTIPKVSIKSREKLGVIMARLTAKARKKIPTKKFGLPAERKYPMPDKSHAANAKARATQQVKAGNLSEAQKAKIDAKANKILKKGKKKKK